jgi:hypothetical protein
MEKQTLPEEFKEFLKLLNECDIEYLLIGGYAMGYHGYPRTTADMDIWVATSYKEVYIAVKALWGKCSMTLYWFQQLSPW